MRAATSHEGYLQQPHFCDLHSDRKAVAADMTSRSCMQLRTLVAAGVRWWSYQRMCTAMQTCLHRFEMHADTVVMLLLALLQAQQFAV